jgi:ferric-dicitrate binding protein FerR (iron transport regulator)
VASVERRTGQVLWSAGKEKLTALPADAVGRPIPAGAELETGGSTENPGFVALRMAGGASVRLDAGTRSRLASPTVVELERGGVYIDTGGAGNSHEDVAVRTAAGLFQGIGTQFEVRAEEGGTVSRLKVREGRVLLARGGESVLTDAGQELVVEADGSLDRGETAADGPEWDWVLTSAPMLDIEGTKVRTFLDWLARERGWRVELADSETAALSDSVVLHGSIAHLTPAEAPDVVLPSGGLGYRVSKGTLVVFVAGKEPVRTPR